MTEDQENGDRDLEEMESDAMADLANLEVERIPRKLIVKDPELKDCHVEVGLSDDGPTYKPIRSFQHTELTEGEMSSYQLLLVSAETLAMEYYKARDEGVCHDDGCEKDNALITQCTGDSPPIEDL